jgi:hypothetical protein
MAEYAGYLSGKGDVVDWNKVTTGLQGAIATVAGARELRRAENSALKMAAENEASKNPNMGNKTLQDFLVNGANNARTSISDLYRKMQRGEISRSEYKAAMANLQTDWQGLATTVKTIDQKIQDAVARQESGEYSIIDAQMALKLGQIADFNKSGITVNEYGKVMLSQDNGDGTFKTFGVNAINNNLERTFKKADVSALVSAAVDGWQERVKKNIADIRLSGDEWVEGKKRVVSTIMADPSTAMSILVDSGGGEDYVAVITEADRTAAIQELSAKGIKNPEDYIIQMQENENGIFQPVLTDKQAQEAAAKIDNEIELQHGVKEDYPEVRSYGGGGGGSSSNDDKKQTEVEDAFNGYLAAGAAFVDGDVSMLNLDPKVKAVARKGSSGAWEIWVYDADDYQFNASLPKKSEVKRKAPLEKVKKIDGLAPYVFSGDVNGAQRMFALGRQEFINRYGARYTKGDFQLVRSGRKGGGGGQQSTGTKPSSNMSWVKPTEKKKT